VSARRRSHPPSLIKRARRTLSDHRLLDGVHTVLCACSGGPDSTAMLHALSFLRKDSSIELVAHGVDHGLRPEAADELELARRVALGCGVPFDVTVVRVEQGSNLQARARAARFDALRQAASRLDRAVIATGHTADDRAETVMMRLMRGAGPRGLAVLPPRAGDLIRPLIHATRADVSAHVDRHGIEVAQDPSNTDRRFLRVRVRRELMPLLRELSPRITEQLCGLADALAGQQAAAGPLAGLGRAQRREIERARQLGRAGVMLRLAGGRDVIARIEKDGSVLIEGKGT